MGGTIDKYCDDCFYLRKGNGFWYCTYFTQTNQRRPCPAGDGCTVKVPRKVYRKKVKKWLY